MIHLHDKLWACIAGHRDVEDTEYKLAYMTHREYNKDNTEAEKFLKRKNTGKDWARGYRHSSTAELPTELEFDNKPVQGFVIVGSQSRWSTDNKVIRVEDPRKFVVEIPVSALTTLMKFTTIVNGVVQGECLWGREGNNHILIPVNSDIYKKAFTQTEQHNNKVKISTLSEGDEVKFSVDDSRTYIYAGKYKAVWELTKLCSTKKNNRYWNSNWERLDTDKVVSVEEVPDNGYKHLFLYKDNKGNLIDQYKSTGECIVISSGNIIPEIDDTLKIYAPNKLCPYDYRNYEQIYSTVKFLRVEKKESK